MGEKHTPEATFDVRLYYYTVLSSKLTQLKLLALEAPNPLNPQICKTRNKDVFACSLTPSSISYYYYYYRTQEPHGCCWTGVNSLLDTNQTKHCSLFDFVYVYDCLLKRWLEHCTLSDHVKRTTTPKHNKTRDSCSFALSLFSLKCACAVSCRLHGCSVLYWLPHFPPVNSLTFIDISENGQMDGPSVSCLFVLTCRELQSVNKSFLNTARKQWCSQNQFTAIPREAVPGWPLTP